MFAGPLAGIGKLAQNVRGLRDVRQDFIDAELEEALARAAVVLVGAPKADDALGVGELAAKAAREVAGVVRGVQNPTLKVMDALATALGVPIFELFTLRKPTHKGAKR